MFSTGNHNAIKALDVAHQELIVSQYNEEHKGNQNKIPLVLRNQASGWPLLQVSFLSPTEDGNYVPALNGGKCHDFNIPLLGLAILLAQVPGKKSITIHGKNIEDLHKFNFDNINNLGILEQFTFTHSGIGMTLALEHNAFGVMSTITTPNEDDAGVKIVNAMWNILGLVTSNKVPMMGGWHDKNSDIVTPKMIDEYLNKDQAIFYNGQVFIDLGLLLTNEKLGLSAEFINYMRNVFKVNEFRNLTFPVYQENAASIDQPEDSAYFVINEDRKRELINAIEALKIYGENIIEQGSKDKGEIVKNIALTASTMLNNFTEDPAKKTVNAFEDFKRDFIATLNARNAELGKYRFNFLTIAANIAIALTGIGAIAVVAKMLYSKINYGRTLGFFASTLTGSEVKRNDVVAAINGLSV